MKETILFNDFLEPIVVNEYDRKIIINFYINDRTLLDLYDNNVSKLIDDNAELFKDIPKVYIEEFKELPYDEIKDYIVHNNRLGNIDNHSYNKLVNLIAHKIKELVHLSDNKLANVYDYKKALIDTSLRPAELYGTVYDIARSILDNYNYIFDLKNEHTNILIEFTDSKTITVTYYRRLIERVVISFNY